MNYCGNPKGSAPSLDIRAPVAGAAYVFVRSGTTLIVGTLDDDSSQTTITTASTDNRLSSSGAAFNFYRGP